MSRILIPERNKALRYYDTGDGDQPPYSTLRFLIENGYLTPANMVTAKGRQLLQQLDQVEAK